jgi:hypothetical protein
MTAVGRVVGVLFMVGSSSETGKMENTLSLGSPCQTSMLEADGAPPPREQDHAWPTPDALLTV